MNDLNLLTAARGICAISFAGTALLLLPLLFQRFYGSMKNRLLQLTFAFGLTAIFAVALARAEAAPALPRHLELGLTLVDQITAAQAEQVFTDASDVALNRYGGSWNDSVDPSFVRFLDVPSHTLAANNTTCAPLVTHLLAKAYAWNWTKHPFTYVDAQGKSVTIKTASPRPEQYVLFIKNQVGFAARITSLRQVQAGDVMAIMPTATEVGHVTLVVNVDLASAVTYPSALAGAKPELAGTTFYAVDVLDSSSGLHTDDSRLVTVGGVITQVPGVGTGRMGVLVDAAGAVVGHTWSLPNADAATQPAAWLNGLHSRLRLQSQRELVFGRMPVLP